MDRRCPPNLLGILHDSLTPTDDFAGTCCPSRRYNICCEAVLALLRRGAKIDSRESAGEYPLHIAALFMADRVVDLLLR